MKTLIRFTLSGLIFLSLSTRADLTAELLSITEHLAHDGRGQLADGGQVYQPAILEQFYASGNYQPAWVDRQQAQEVLAILAASVKEGLQPSDYHYDELASLWRRRDSTVWENRDRMRARFDVLLSDGLLLYVRHLLEGKVDPNLMAPTFNYGRRTFDPIQVATKLRQAIADNNIAQAVDAAQPDLPFYQQMKDALAHYRAQAKIGGFRRLPEDAVFKPGESYPGISNLRERLAELGYPSQASDDGTLYDASLRAAVEQFQADHGIDVDGVIGRQSYAALNMSPAQRVDSLRINMDRLRWIVQDLSDDFIVVNIAGFELYYLRDQNLVWETPVMTGTVAHQTPVFTSRLRYLEFNPTWTVPRSIIGRSLLPKFKKDPTYLAANDYVLYDRDGQEVDPLSLDWSGITLSNFPYRVVQQPGDKNALGQVKFIFPNEYAIYLHDTPSRALFSRSARAFSSGCVRVKDPFQLAEVLLDNPDKWSRAKIEALVASRKPQARVFMDRDVDVMLMYWTTSPTAGGRLQFHPDIYGKDPAALAALNAPPSKIDFTQN